MVERAANADYDRLHDEKPFHDGTFSRWAKDRSTTHPFHFRDGVTITVSDEDWTPDDDFLKREAVSRGDQA